MSSRFGGGAIQTRCPLFFPAQLYDHSCHAARLLKRPAVPTSDTLSFTSHTYSIEELATIDPDDLRDTDENELG